MRRTVLLALLTALLLAPTARAAGTTTQILRDCVDDGVLQGHYTQAALRTASKNLPTDIDEYSNCRDVLSRAVSAAGGSGGTGGTGVGGTGGGGGTTGGGAGTESGTITSTGTSPSAGSPAAAPRPAVTPTTPVSQQDWEAVKAAAQHGGEPVQINGHAVSPGATRLAAKVGRNELPGALIAVLALVGAAGLAATGTLVRRRGFAHRTP